MKWTELFLFLETAVLFFVFGMMIMGVVATKGRYEATTEAYKIGYEKGVNAEKERIGNLLDKYIEDLGRGNNRDSERVSITNNIS